jgi:N-6 DNA methylase
VARAAERLAASSGVRLPADLRIWTLAGGTDPPPGVLAPEVGVMTRLSGVRTTGVSSVDGPDGLAAALEAATDAGQRRANGLHVTPPWVADHLVALAFGGSGGAGSVCDPACGGGVFLVAAARALHAAGVPKGEVVRERIWGADIDPVGLAAAEAALALWSGGEVPPPGRLVVGDPLRRGPALWPDRWPGGVDVVVGNPPFQSQLGRATARARTHQSLLRDRFGDAVRPYTDTAWLFLLLGCELVRPGGRVVLVQPDSLVAARDAAAVRDAVDGAADLLDLWVDERQVFAAAVRVCAPVLRVRPGPGDDGGGATARWHDLLADATGVPAVDLAPSAGRVGDRAALVAGFRDEYYGLAAVTAEAPPGGPGPAQAPLVTAGVVDWGRSAWGRRPVRFAKRSWAAPVVDLARVEAEGTPAARRWLARTRGPKLVVATQTKVLEVAVDESGEWVPSVPVIAVVPHKVDDLWPLAAALAAPAATAWLARRAPGAALTRGALKIAARDIASLPLPTDVVAWKAATEAFRAVVEGDGGASLDAFVEAGAAAYGSAPAVVTWWRTRLDQAERAAASPSISTGPVGERPG